MFFAKIPRHTRQNAITEGDLECILTRNCEGNLNSYKIKIRKKLRSESGCCRSSFVQENAFT